MVNLTNLEAEIKEAEKKKEEELIEAQIEVYEGQNYQAREAYEKAQEKYTATRRKLPKDVSTDKDYKEQDLQAQYIQARVIAPEQEKQVKEYRDEIKKQQKASKEIQVLDKELPQLYTSAVQEVESVKTGVEKAKKKVEEKYDAVIQTKQETYDTEKARRAKQYADVEKTYQETLAKTPYTDEALKKEISARGSRHFSPRRFSYEWGKQSQNYNKRALEVKQSAEASLRYEHYTLEGHNVGQKVPPNAGKDVFKMINEMKHVDARDLHSGYGYVKVGVARRNLLSGMYGIEEYNKQVSAGITAYKESERKRTEAKLRTSKAQLASAVQQDRAHWANVASNPYTSNPNATTPNFTVGSGTKDDPFRTDYNKGKTAVGETTTPPKEMVAYYLTNYQDQAKKYNKAKTGLETTTFKETDTGKDVTSQSLQQIQKQRETELANRRQQQHVAELRAGNIGLSDALMNPQTTQSYTGTSTVNLKTFLKERGYDLNKPEAIPDSVLTKPVKYTEAREQAKKAVEENITMGDLRTKEPYYAGFGVQDGKMNFKYKYPEASAETQLLRRQAKERIAQFDPVIPSSDKVQGTKTGFRFTNLKDPQVGTLDSGGVFTKKDFNPYSASDPIGMAQGYQYVVPSKGVTALPTITGQTFDAKTPTSFDTKAEAKAYLKESKPKVFSGTDNDLWNKFQYASAVDSGELPNPKTTPTLVDDVRYYANVMNRPLINLGASVVNLTQPQDKQVPIYQTGAERLIGGTIDDTLEGQPLRGTGVTGTYNYVKQDPLRAVLELPAEGLMWIAGGKAVTLGTQAVGKVGGKVIQTVVTSSKTPAPVVSGIKTTQRGIEKAQEKMLQYNPFTRWQYKQVEKIGSSVYPDEVPRRIEKIGSTYVITSGTESFPQSVPAVMVKFGKGGKTSYYTDSDLGVAGSKGLIVVGDLPKGIAESTKTGKYLFEVPVKGDRVKLKDYSKTGKEYVAPIESFTKQDVGQQVGFKVSEKTGVARKSDEPPFYRGYTKETIIETSTKPQLTKVKYDMDGKVIKDVPVDNKGSTLKDLFGKTSGTGKKETIDLPTGKSGQTLTTPAKQTGKGDKLKSLAKEEAKSSVKTSPYSSAIVGTATKASAVVGTKALASTRVDTGVKIQQEIKTGLVQETALKTQQELKTPQRLKTGMRMETGLKLDTGSKLMTQQKTALSFSSPIKTQSRTQRPKALPFVLPKVEETETRGKRKRGKKAGFIGNVRLDNIMGMYKRKEITYGQKKVTKLERQDMRLTAGTKNRIALPSSGLLKTKKKKKSKSETILGRTVTKTKDEFVGFKENKTKKQTKRRKKSKKSKVRLL